MQKNQTRLSLGNHNMFLMVSVFSFVLALFDVCLSLSLSLWCFVCSNVSGFVYVTEVDVLRKKITYLAPSPGALPSKFLVAGSLTWLESH